MKLFLLVSLGFVGSLVLVVLCWIAWYLGKTGNRPYVKW